MLYNYGQQFCSEEEATMEGGVEGGCGLVYYPIRYDILNQVDVLMQAEVKVTKASCIM